LIEVQFGGRDDDSQPGAQKDRQPGEQSPEVVAGGGEDGVGGVAGPVSEVVAAHPVLGFEMADAGLDRRAAAQVPFDRFGDAPFLAGDKDPEPVLGRSIVAAATMLRIALR
jgi:hypothetical protein